MHDDCLMQWINHSKNQTCELCKHQFHFTNIYAEDAPRKLRLMQVVIGALQMGGQSFTRVLRILLVIFMWTVVTPIITSWLWRLYFSRSTTDILEIFNRTYSEL